MNQHVPRILVVGAVTADFDQRWGFNLSADPDLDKKKTLLHVDFMLGGGAGNCAIGLKLLDQAFRTYSHVEVDTRVGTPPPGDLVAEVSELVIRRRLEGHQIRYKDVTLGESHNALNGVNNFPEDLAEHFPSGRLIGRDPYVTTGDLELGYQQTIANDVHGSDIVFVDPKKRRIALAAVLSAKEDGKESVVDWGQDSWPGDQEGAMCFETIKNAGTVIVPDDAIVAGMNGKNPDELFDRLLNDYGVQNLVMSNGGQPVRYFIDGIESKIPVHALGKTVDSNASGDTRNAGYVWSRARGFSKLDALEFGSALGSAKRCHPGLEWVNHVVDDLRRHPRVSHMVDRLLPEQGVDAKLTHS